MTGSIHFLLVVAATHVYFRLKLVFNCRFIEIIDIFQLIFIQRYLSCKRPLHNKLK